MKVVSTLPRQTELLLRWLLLPVFFLLIAPSLPAQPQEETPTIEQSEIVEEILEETEETEDPATTGEAAAETSADIFDATLSEINTVLDAFLFFDVSFGIFATESHPDNILPLLVVVLFAGAVFFTFFYGFINLRGFKHSIDVLRGKFDNPSDHGEVSHFHALTSALSATVGLGNIAGVAIAINVGGPGAVVWMVLTAFFGMSSKFSSCTLAQMFRKTNSDGTISGGPMYYLDIAFKQKGGAFAPFGKVLAIIFAIMVMGGAIGGGNMFQANQSFEVVSYVFDFQSDTAASIYGVILMILVGLVIIGGIRRIGAATSRIVPLMAVIYVIGCLVVIIAHIGQVPSALGMIVKQAFSENALYGGFIGVLVMGIRRAAFSNEAGLGSAAIAHAAARTKEPVREGIVAMIGPFVDTVIICTMTALVVIVTGTYTMTSDEVSQLMAGSGIQPGAVLTAVSFGSVVSWFPYILAIAVVLFAYSTMISWCYYGERGWIYLLDHLGADMGIRSVIVFRIFFILCVYVGAVVSLGNLLNLSDILLLSMAFPNIVGMIFLAPIVKRALDDYMRRYKSGEMKPVK